jgi:hypothetical protein
MTGTTPPLVPTVTFEFEGESYTAVADHMMIVRYERLAGQSFAHILLHIELVRKYGEMPKFSEFGYLLQAMLGDHHPDIGLDVTIKMVANADVIEHMAEILGAALPSGEKDSTRPLAKAAKAPRQRKKSGTGTA